MTAHQEELATLIAVGGYPLVVGIARGMVDFICPKGWDNCARWTAAGFWPISLSILVGRSLVQGPRWLVWAVFSRAGKKPSLPPAKVVKQETYFP